MLILHSSSRSVLKTERWVGQEIVAHKSVRNQVCLGPSTLSIALALVAGLVKARHVVAVHVVGHDTPAVLLRVPASTTFIVFT